MRQRMTQNWTLKWAQQSGERSRFRPAGEEQFVAATGKQDPGDNEMSIASIPRHDHVPIAHWSEGGSRAHTVQFYGEDISLLKELSCFIGAALMAGDAAVVLAPKAHPGGRTQRLPALGFDTAKAFKPRRDRP